LRHRPGINRLPPRRQRKGASFRIQELSVGKGDRKTRRGKIYRGSFGKSRPKDPAKKATPAAKGSTTRK